MIIYEDIKDNHKGLMDSLSDAWNYWLQHQNIPRISADDLMHSHYMDTKDGCTTHQAKFTETFCRLWDLAQEIEND